MMSTLVLLGMVQERNNRFESGYHLSFCLAESKRSQDTCPGLIREGSFERMKQLHVGTKPNDGQLTNFELRHTLSNRYQSFER
jgi:hypothetical protein